MWFVSLCK